MRQRPALRERRTGLYMLAALFGAACVVQPAAAAPISDPKACSPTFASQFKSATDLRAADPGVYARPGNFQYRGHAYPFETFSAVAQPSPASALWCFRDEVENTGHDEIFDLTWQKLYDRGERQDLPPGTRAIGRTRDWSLQPPVIAPTTLYAFESRSAQSGAYAKDDSRAPPAP